MDTHINNGKDRGTQGKQVAGRGKPQRKVSRELVYYSLPHSEIQFRFDGICVYLVYLYGKPMSMYQIKVLMTMWTLLNGYGYTSLSYHDVDKAGAMRGMSWQDVLRSMQILHGFGLLETFGRTAGGNHYKYVLSVEGDRLMDWINAEMSCPSVTLTFKSKAFSAPGHAA